MSIRMNAFFHKVFQLTKNLNISEINSNLLILKIEVIFFRAFISKILLCKPFYKSCTQQFSFFHQILIPLWALATSHVPLL